jgi:GTP1/Obg family GTP-binding protein
MLKKITALIGLATLVAGASAQDFDRTVASIMLLQDQKIQAELKVTKAQRDKMNTHAAAFQKVAKAYGEKLQKQGKNAKANPAEENKMLGTLKNNILGTLTAAQIKRLREISLQVLGVGAIGDDLVAARLGLSATQKTDVRKHLSDGLQRANAIQQKTMTEARKGIKEPKNEAEAKKAQQTFDSRMKTLGPPAQKQLNVIRMDVQKKVLAILTPVQRTTWTGLLGKTFNP